VRADAAFQEAMDDARERNLHILTASGKQKSPNVVRGEIRRFLATKVLTQTAWLQAIGVGPGSYNNFMKPGYYKDQWSAVQNQSYWACAWDLFKRKKASAELAKRVKKYETQQRRAAAKAAKAASSTGAASKKLPSSSPVASAPARKRKAEDAFDEGATDPAAAQAPQQQQQQQQQQAKPLSKKQRTEDLLASVRAIDVPRNGPVYDNCDVIRKKVCVCAISVHRFLSTTCLDTHPVFIDCSPPPPPP
jgi:pyruvate/2-oxoglutarate dehydrogenase complex dihydrolipoamide acyltransferase (E2) component